MSCSCEFCMNYIYDEDMEMMVCAIDLDQDEYARFVTRNVRSCPYFRMGDEYSIVKKQI